MAFKKIGLLGKIAIGVAALPAVLGGCNFFDKYNTPSEQVLVIDFMKLDSFKKEHHVEGPLGADIYFCDSEKDWVYNKMMHETLEQGGNLLVMRDHPSNNPYGDECGHGRAYKFEKKDQ